MSNRRKLEEVQQIELNSNGSALIRNELPEKLDDPGKFSVPCAIGKVKFNYALCDLGASVSLMPKSVKHSAIGRSVSETPYRDCGGPPDPNREILRAN